MKKRRPLLVLISATLTAGAVMMIAARLAEVALPDAGVEAVMIAGGTIAGVMFAGVTFALLSYARAMLAGRRRGISKTLLTNTKIERG